MNTIATAFTDSLGNLTLIIHRVSPDGKKIDKSYLTYAQGASAEMIAMVITHAANINGLPFFNMPFLSSDDASNMAINKSNLQRGIERNLAMTWVLTLPRT